MLGISEAPYVAFCDQDDIWLEDKLATQFAVMLDAEKTLTSDCPILIHSDLRVVDSNLNLLSDSLWNYQKLNPERMKLMQRMLIHNYVTGCASIINRKLIDISMPIPINVVMHDWWIALIAIARGAIISIPETTVLYRQHDENDTGAVNWSLKYFIKIIIKGPQKLYIDLLERRNQAAELLKTEVLAEKDRVLVERFVNMFSLNWFSRRITMFRYGFLKYGFMRNLALLLVL